jgi:cytoskeletal protein CcmA (bactofilin family)
VLAELYRTRAHLHRTLAAPMRLDILASTLASSLLTGVLVVAVTAVADGDPSTDQVPRIIPYNGMLELDGVPVNLVGDAAPFLRFELTDGAAGPVVFTQQAQVQVYGGRFTVLLGPTGTGGVRLDDVVADADDLFVRITLLGEVGTAADDIVLAGSQRVLMSPFAMWATDATDFAVARDLAVARNTTLGGTLAITGDASLGRDLFVARNIDAVGEVEAGTLQVDGASTLTGAVEAGTLQVDGASTLTGAVSASSTLTVAGNTTLNGILTVRGPDIAIAHSPRGDGGLALVHQFGDRLVLNYENRFSGDTQVQSDLLVSGRLGTGGLTTGLNHNSCTWRNVNPYDLSNNIRHEVSCNNGEFMVGWGCRASDRLDGECRIQCCQP